MAGNGLLIGLLTIGKERLSYDFRSSRKTSHKDGRTKTCSIVFSVVP
jgi:hypothetical protein